MLTCVVWWKLTNITDVLTVSLLHTLMMEVVITFETLGSFYQNTGCNLREIVILIIRHFKNASAFLSTLFITMTLPYHHFINMFASFIETFPPLFGTVQ
jgi:hypothetical protein